MPPFLPSASTIIDFSPSAALCLHNGPLHAVIADLLLPDKNPSESCSLPGAKMAATWGPCARTWACPPVRGVVFAFPEFAIMSSIPSLSLMFTLTL